MLCGRAKYYSAQHYPSEAILCGRRDVCEPVVEMRKVSAKLQSGWPVKTQTHHALASFNLFSLEVLVLKCWWLKKPETERSRSTSSSTPSTKQGICFLFYFVFSVEVYEAWGKDWPASLPTIPFSVSLAVTACHAVRAIWSGIDSSSTEIRHLHK